MTNVREYALFRVEDENNTYFMDTYSDEITAIKEAVRQHKLNPKFCYEVEARRVIFSVGFFT